MMEPFQTSISSAALNKINQMLTQKKAAGKKVEPWELEAAYKAAMETDMAKASDDYYKAKILALQERALTEEEKYKKKLLEAEKGASTWSGIGTLGSTALLGKALKIW